MLRLVTSKVSQRHVFTTTTTRFLNTQAIKGSIKEGWEAVIGIEVHAQINTKSKLFSGNLKTSRSCI